MQRAVNITAAVFWRSFDVGISCFNARAVSNRCVLLSQKYGITTEKLTNRSLRDLNRMGSLSIASELIVDHVPRKSWRK